MLLQVLIPFISGGILYNPGEVHDVSDATIAADWIAGGLMAALPPAAPQE
jgi:hypothetical protein